MRVRKKFGFCQQANGSCRQIRGGRLRMSLPAKLKIFRLHRNNFKFFCPRGLIQPIEKMKKVFWLKKYVKFFVNFFLFLKKTLAI